MKRRYRELDDAIAGAGDGDDAEINALTDTAHLLERTLDAESPYAARERAFFIEAVAARTRRRGFWATIGPVLAGAAVVGAFGFAARSALPGEQIYPLRKAIAAVGLAESSNEEITTRLERSRTAVNSAEELIGRAPERARELAIDAVVELRLIERLLSDVGIVRRTTVQDELESLERRAAAVISASFSEEDSSGPSGDDADDSSGPGGDNDSSGPGGDDDSSGPGSGDDSSDDDNSGSGSGTDNSGSGDNSAPGGGGDDSGSGD